MGDPITLLVGPSQDLVGSRLEVPYGVGRVPGQGNTGRDGPGEVGGRVEGDDVHAADIVEDLAANGAGQGKISVGDVGRLAAADLDGFRLVEEPRPRMILRDEIDGARRARIEEDLPRAGRHIGVDVVSAGIRWGSPRAKPAGSMSATGQVRHRIAEGIEHAALDNTPISLFEPAVDVRGRISGLDPDRVGGGEVDLIVVPFVDQGYTPAGVLIRTAKLPALTRSME